MGFGRKNKKKSNLSERRRQAVINYMAGVLEAAFLAAAADGELEESEYEVFVAVFNQLAGEEVSQRDIDKVITACAEALESDGFDARMDQIVDKLPTDEARAAALYAVAAVVLSDDDYDPDSEGSFYDDLAVKLGVDEQTAIDIWNDMVESYS